MATTWNSNTFSWW